MLLIQQTAKMVKIDIVNKKLATCWSPILPKNGLLIFYGIDNICGGATIFKV